MTLIFGKRYTVYNLAPCIILVLVCVHVKHAVEIHKRVGAFAMALQTINKCLSDAVCAMARSMLDGESRAAALILAMKFWRQLDTLLKPGYFPLLFWHW